MGGYYERSSETHIDGSPIFKTREDQSNEDAIRAQVEERWKCKLHTFGSLSVIDWWAERHGRIIGYLELKSRSHETTKYKTVFLSHKKWLALSLSQLSGQPAIFVVKFTDETRWIKLDDVDPRRLIIGGCRKIVKSCSDIEPVIEVPIGSMTTL